MTTHLTWICIHHTLGRSKACLRWQSLIWLEGTCRNCRRGRCNVSRLMCVQVTCGSCDLGKTCECKEMAQREPVEDQHGRWWLQHVARVASSRRPRSVTKLPKLPKLPKQREANCPSANGHQLKPPTWRPGTAICCDFMLAYLWGGLREPDASFFEL